MTADEFQRLFRQASRFGISGLIVTALHSTIAATLVESAGLHPSWANAGAYVAANITSYLLHTYWSFSQRPSAGSWIRFVTVSIIGLIITVAVSSFIDSLGWHYGIGIAAVLVTVPAATFLMHRYWTYR